MLILHVNKALSKPRFNVKCKGNNRIIWIKSLCGWYSLPFGPIWLRFHHRVPAIIGQMSKSSYWITNNFLLQKHLKISPIKVYLVNITFGLLVAVTLNQVNVKVITVLYNQFKTVLYFPFDKSCSDWTKMLIYKGYYCI